MISNALITFLAIAIVMAKMPKNLLRKILGIDWLIDAGMTIGIGIAFYGTYSGMMTAAAACVAISGGLWLGKRIYGYDVLTWKGWRHVEPTIDLRHRLALAREELK